MNIYNIDNNIFICAIAGTGSAHHISKQTKSLKLVILMIYCIVTGVISGNSSLLALGALRVKKGYMGRASLCAASLPPL